MTADEYLNSALGKSEGVMSADDFLNQQLGEGVSPAEPERRAGGGITGGAADVGVQFMKGLGTGTRMISDVFGANNPVSKSIAGYEDYMDSLLSAESKQDSQEISRILKDAEGKGILPQVMAGIEAFTVAPAEMTATTMGMMLPNLAGGVYAKAAQLTKAGVLGLQMGIGAAQGMGSVKGQIYTAVQEELRQQGLPEDQIDKVATEAQAYNGKNLDQILIGAGLGAAASSTGAEKIMTRLITGAGKEATEDIIKATIKGGLAEAPIEALQGGQEKVAENVALQRIGVDVPTMQGVIPAATMEATAGLLIGGGLGGVEAFVSPEKKEETDIDKQAQQTANEFLAPNDPTSQAMVKELARRENAVKNLQEAYDVLEPTSQEAQRLKLELGDAQRKLSAYKEIANKAGLSLPITTAEQQQIELAKQIARKPAQIGAMPSPAAQTAEATYGAATGVYDVFGGITRKPVSIPKPAKLPTAPTIEEQTAERTYGGETGVFDVFAGARRKPVAPEASAITPAPVEEVAATSEFLVPPNALENIKGIPDLYEAVKRDALSGYLVPAYISNSVSSRNLPKGFSQSLIAKVKKQVGDNPSISEIEDAIETQVEKTAYGKEKKKADEVKLESALQRTGETYELDVAIQDYKNKQTELERTQKSILTTPALRQIERVGAKNNLEKSKQKLIEIAAKPAPVAETPAVTPAAEVAPALAAAENAPQRLIRSATESGLKPIKPREVGALRGFYTFQAKDSGSKIAFSSSATIAEESPNELNIEAIYTPPKERGTGSASRLLNEILSIADNNNITLKLEPKGISDLAQEGDVFLTKKQLASWYKRYGFQQETEGSDDILVRTPAVSETITPAAEPAGKPKLGEKGGVLIPSREDFIQAGQNIYEKGMEFGAWAKQMIQRFGDAVRQFLGDVWEAVSGFPAKLEEMAGYLPGKGERGAVTLGRGEEPKNMDTEYLAAVERGDMETAQRMVDEAAKKAGYDVGPVWHGSPDFIGNEFDLNMRGRRGLSRGGFSFTRNKDAAEAYMKSGVDPSQKLVDDANALMKELQSRVDAGLEWNGPYNEVDVPFFRSDSVDDIDSFQFYISEISNTLPDDLKLVANELAGRTSPEDYTANPRLIRAFLKQPQTIDIAGKELLLAESSEQIKSADPVTYDDAGNVIPLSQRFQPSEPDIRMAPTEQPAQEKPITDPATPDEQTQQLVQQAQEQESIVDAAVKEAGDDVFNVFNRLVNEGKTEDQVAKELGISNYDVRKYKLRADTAILNKMKQKKVKPLAFAPKNPVAEFAEKNLRKYFTKEGWLPKAVFQSWVKRNAALSREQKEAEFAIKDLYAGIREVFGISKMEMITKGLVSVPPEFVQQLNDAMAKKIDINTMPEPVREPLTRMRQHIDAMSRQLVDLNVLPDELSAKISENLGVYLTRSYKIFTDKNWINKIPTEKLTAARNFLYQQQLKNDPEATIEMADRELRNMLNDWASDAEGLRKRGGKLGAKDLSVMMERAKVPKVLREVMGENTNVIFNYANTIGKISRFVSDQKFLNEVKAKGTGEFLFTEKDAPKGFNTQIAAEESRTMSPLNGLRTTPEIAKAFEEFGKGYDARENPGLYVLAWLNAVGKLNLTVGSVLTQMRNLLGQPAFFVFNGHYNWRVIRQEIDAIAKEKGISQEDAKKELVKLAAAQGLVNENAYAGELRTAFQEVGLETFDDIGPDEFTKQFVLTRMYLKGVKSAQELYQKTDEFGKIVGWLNETKRIQRMNKGMDKQTAQSIAAERTRDTYPTYSQSSEALRLFRRQPFVGPFATFFYETFRTSFHNLRYAFEDINGPTPEHKAEGIKRLAGAMTTLSMGAFGINLISKLASGIGDDEEEDVRRMLPPWAKDASLAWMPKSKDGTYNFINVSYINPYNAMTDPFIAMMSGFAKGDKPEEIAVQALGSFLSPFTSEQPVTATIGDAARNRTSTGKQIYNPQDDITTKTSKIMLHIFGKTFTPGTINRLRERIIPAIQGETVGTRAPAPAKEIAAELTGIRFETLDMKAAFSSKAWEFSRAANESERIFRDVATRRRRVDEQEQVDAYRRSEQTRYEIWNDMYRDYMAVRRAGASQGEAVRLMTDIGISKKEAIAISKGRYVPYQVSDEVLRRSKLNENKVPIKEIRVIGKEMPRVLTDIKKTP